MKKLSGVIRAQQFSERTVKKIFSIAEQMESSPPADLLKGKLMVSLFYEPSTRTRLSFESAMKRLGGGVIGTENAKDFSSKAKGESLEDSVRVASNYADVIVLRYHKKGGAKRAQNFSRVPIVNAGDGIGQHPTQALLDLYTIKKYFGKIKGLKIAMVGDLANGRTVRSLCYFLAKHFPSNKVYFVSPKKTRMKNDIKRYLDCHDVKWTETYELTQILPKVDVVYQTRVQEERFKKKQSVYKQIVRDSKKLIINKKSLRLMKPNAIIMHPLPRIAEISYDVDNDKRAIYFEQARNGVFIRMALLKMILVGY